MRLPRGMCAFACVVIVAYWTAVAHSASASKIVLNNGTVYDDVAYTLEREYRILTATKADWERAMSFMDIAYIYDSDGNDVTEDELGMIYRTSDTTTEASAAGQASPESVSDSMPSGTDMGLDSPVRKQIHPWRFAVKTGGNYSIPLSEFYDGFSDGAGFEAEAIIPVAREIAVRLSASRAGIKDDRSGCLQN